MSFNVVQYQYICTMLYLCDKSSVCKLNKTGKYLYTSSTLDWSLADDSGLVLVVANSLTVHQYTGEAEVDTLIHNLGS